MISDAVILMAGSGSRFNAAGPVRLKPLLPFCGRPLITHTFNVMVNAGIRSIYAVIGFEADALRSAITPLLPSSLSVQWIQNPDWQKQNGVSALAARAHLPNPFILTMGDHVFDQAILDLVQREASSNTLTVAVDRDIESIFDLDDAMKVQIRGQRLVAIGKDLRRYNAVDTGIFACPPKFFDYLEQAKSENANDDCSLADGIRLMAKRGEARGVGIADAWWQDIDTPAMLANAEQQLRARRAAPVLTENTAQLNSTSHKVRSRSHRP